MGDFAAIAGDPAFRTLLRKRSQLRWSFSGALISAYLCYGIVGLQLPDSFAGSFLGTSVPWGMALGFILIGASVLMSLIYVRAINRLEATFASARKSK